MQQKIWKFIQYGYLVVGIIFLIEAIVNWNIDRTRSYFHIGFAIFIIFIFFFKRNFRRKIEKRNQNK